MLAIQLWAAVAGAPLTGHADVFARTARLEAQQAQADQRLEQRLGALRERMAVTDGRWEASRPDQTKEVLARLTEIEGRLTTLHDALHKLIDRPVPVLREMVQ